MNKSFGFKNYASRGSLKERLLSRIEPITETGCWVWLGSADRLGYGRIGEGGSDCKTLLAHRVSYALFNGPLLPGKQIHHKCYVPACINPAHLAQVTNRENTIDAMRKGKCRNGHDMTDPENQRLEGNSKEYLTCQKCRQAAWRRQSNRRKALRAIKRLPQ